VKGEIINFYANKGFGFIKGENNKKYFFHISNVINPENIEINSIVKFKEKKDNKGLSALNIEILTPSYEKKDRILKIDRLRIKASNIKEYEMITFKDYEDYCEYNYIYYGIKITTYTSGIKTLEYNYYNEDENRNLYNNNNYEDCEETYWGTDYNYQCHCEKYHNEIENKSYNETQKWLNYIDEEMDKFLL
jgi:cold shock CspA family protein